MFDLSALSTEKPQTLDITGWKETGEKLTQAIEDAVKSTQSVIIRALPDRIIMTQIQYNDLTGQPEMLEPEDEYGQSQEYYLYRTPLNVMEVEIK